MRLGPTVRCVDIQLHVPPAGTLRALVHHAAEEQHRDHDESQDDAGDGNDDGSAEVKLKGAWACGGRGRGYEHMRWAGG